MSLNVKTKTGRKGNHVIVIARGSLDGEGLKRIFREVASATRYLPDSKVLIDLVDANFELQPAEIDVFVDGLRPEPWLYKKQNCPGICARSRGVKQTA
jgi:hypothetical protein